MGPAGFREFRDRADAGRALAAELAEYRGGEQSIVLGLPRGGIPVAAEVAAALDLPLDVFTVRKLGVPGHEELAMGAIASGDAVVLNDDVVASLHIGEPAIDEVLRREREELDRRERAYRRGRPRPELRGRTVIVVDDGLATGASMRAAVAALRQQGAGVLVVAVPVAARPTCDAIAEIADRVVCVATPEPFHAVGAWYRDFAQTTDDEVMRILRVT